MTNSEALTLQSSATEERLPLHGQISQRIGKKLRSSTLTNGQIEQIEQFIREKDGTLADVIKIAGTSRKSLARMLETC